MQTGLILQPAAVRGRQVAAVDVRLAQPRRVLGVVAHRAQQLLREPAGDYVADLMATPRRQTEVMERYLEPGGGGG